MTIIISNLCFEEEYCGTGCAFISFDATHENGRVTQEGEWVNASKTVERTDSNLITNRDFDSQELEQIWDELDEYLKD